MWAEIRKIGLPRTWSLDPQSLTSQSVDQSVDTQSVEACGRISPKSVCQESLDPQSVAPQSVNQSVDPQSAKHVLRNPQNRFAENLLTSVAP